MEYANQVKKHTLFKKGIKTNVINFRILAIITSAAFLAPSAKSINSGTLTVKTYKAVETYMEENPSANSILKNRVYKSTQFELLTDKLSLQNQLPITSHDVDLKHLELDIQCPYDLTQLNQLPFLNQDAPCNTDFGPNKNPSQQTLSNLITLLQTPVCLSDRESPEYDHCRPGDLLNTTRLLSGQTLQGFMENLTQTEKKIVHIKNRSYTIGYLALLYEEMSNARIDRGYRPLTDYENHIEFLRKYSTVTEGDNTPINDQELTAYLYRLMSAYEILKNQNSKNGGLIWLMFHTQDSPQIKPKYLRSVIYFGDNLYLGVTESTITFMNYNQFYWMAWAASNLGYEWIAMPGVAIHPEKQPSSTIQNLAEHCIKNGATYLLMSFTTAVTAAAWLFIERYYCQHLPLPSNGEVSGMKRPMPTQN